MVTRTKWQAVLALLLLVPMATVGVGAALWLWPGTVGGQVLYGAGKLWIVLLPALWWRLVNHGSWSWSPPRRGGFGMAIGLGMLMAGAIVGMYAVARHNQWIDLPVMRQMIAKNHLDVVWVYVGVTVLLCTANSLMEEYAWRWFCFQQCEGLMPGWAAALAAAAFFTAHHAVALGAYFDGRVVLLGAAGVFVAGAIWSWMYLRYRSVWPGYVCHVLADIAIFAVGWHLIYG